MHETHFSRDAAVARLHAVGRSRADWRVGIEYESHLLDADGLPMPYAGPNGVASLLGRLSDAGGWSRVHEDQHLIALQRGRCSVTLEPGNQLELSGSPCRTMPEIADELASWCMEVDDALQGTGYLQYGVGLTPVANVDDIEQNPKARYRIMRERMRNTGALAGHMMRGTAAVQANFDWSDEADCAAKVQLSTALGPLTTALFAHSPFERGQATGFMSTRGNVWTQTDPARTGLPDAASRFSFERWVDWLLDVPLLFRKDAEGHWQHGEGSFRDWMTSSSPPTWADWDLHASSVFPEVRVKRTIEIRGADCVPIPLALSFCSLWRTLFYEPAARDRASNIAANFTRHGTANERMQAATRHGLRGLVGGRTLAAWAEDVIDAAEAAIPPNRPDDLRYLQPLARQVERGESPARSLLRAFRRDGDVRRVLALLTPQVDRATSPESESPTTGTLRTGLKGARAIDRISVLARTALTRVAGPDAEETRATLRRLLERMDHVLAAGLHVGLPTDRWTTLRAALQPLEEALDAATDGREPDWLRVSTVARSALGALN